MFTRLMNARSAWLASGLLLAGLGLMMCPTERADAAPFNPSKPEPQKVSNAQLREALHVLQATKKTLEGANHDYGGHRVGAVKAIGAAERQLKLALGTQPNPKKTGKPSGNGARPGKQGGKNREPQAVSNLQLADAIGVLQKTATFLEKADHDYGGHRAAAVRDLGTAVKQLKLALKFEKR
jgi:hypothetical protein